MLNVRALFKTEPQSIPEIEPIDGLGYLQNQHREVDDLFTDLEKAGKHAYKHQQSVVTDIMSKLDHHMRVEENYLYPRIKRIDEADTYEAIEEHEAIKGAISRLRATQSDEASFKARIHVLRELVEHHVKDEESSIFPKIRTLLSQEAINDIGFELQTARRTADGHQNKKSKPHATA